MATLAEHGGYTGVLFAAKPREEAFMVYRLDTPADMTRLTYGGRFYNRAPKATIRMAHSLDGGKTWTETYCLDQHRTAVGRDSLRDGQHRCPPGRGRR